MTNEQWKMNNESDSNFLPDCLMPVFARRRSSNQFRLSGGAERHVRFVDVAQLVPGKLQTNRVNKRRFIKGQLCCERVVRSPGSACGHRLKSLRTPGASSFFPGAVAALDARFGSVETGDNRRRAGLLALQRDAFQSPGIIRKQISLAYNLADRRRRRRGAFRGPERQILQSLSEFFLDGLVRRDPRGGETRQEFLPYEIQNRLHVTQTARDGDDRVLLRQNNAILAERAVAAICAVAATPELIAIALIPVAPWITAVRRLK